MTKQVEFTNTSGQTLYVELGNRTNFEGTPDAFDNDFDGHAQLALIDIYGLFFPDGNDTQKPFFYFRHTDISKNKYRFGNLVDFGDDGLSPQKGVFHPDEIATPDTPVNKYQKLSDNPAIYGFGSDEKFVECRIHNDHLTMKEGDFLSLKAEPWPFTLYDHQSFYKDASIVFQPSTWSGTFNGKPIVGLGSFDRFCVRKDIKSFESVPFGYISMFVMGIREDGRKEFAFVSASLNDVGKTIAYYILEGETPIITDHFTMIADWVHLPYVDDGTCVFKNAIFKFCGKELHFEGKWGLKGFTEKPRIEKHGQSQISGTWYEGKTPYKHRIHCTIVENMEAYDYKLKELGFDVVE